MTMMKRVFRGVDCEQLVCCHGRSGFRLDHSVNALLFSSRSLLSGTVSLRTDIAVPAVLGFNLSTAEQAVSWRTARVCIYVQPQAQVTKMTFQFCILKGTSYLYFAFSFVRFQNISVSLRARLVPNATLILESNHTALSAIVANSSASLLLVDATGGWLCSGALNVSASLMRCVCVCVCVCVGSDEFRFPTVLLWRWSWTTAQA